MNLISQYNQLSDKEKHAILVYKSSLGLLINEINSYLADNDNIEELLQDPHITSVAQEYYDEFLDFYNNDLILRHTLLKSINMKSVKSFIMSIVDINYTLLNCVDKIKLDEPKKLYRLVSYKDSYDDISKGEFVSTTGSLDVCDCFMKRDQNYILYEFDVDSDIPVLVCPYSVKSSYDSIFDYLIFRRPKKIFIEQGDDQDEVVLYKSRCKFEVLSEEMIEKDGFSLKKVKVNVKINQYDIYKQR